MEKNLQGKIISLCNEHAIICYKVESQSVTGFPDLFIAGLGHIELWECKHPNKRGRLRPAQVRRIAELRAAGVTVRVIDDYETGKKIIDRWGSDPTTTGEY